MSRSPADSRVRSLARRLLLLLAAAAAADQAPAVEAARPRPRPSRQAAAPALQPYVERIPRTLVEFEMIPITGGIYEMDDSAQAGARLQVDLKSFWMGRTEVTWDAYDVYLFRLDEDPDAPAEPETDAYSHPSMPYGAYDRGFGHQGYPAVGISAQAAENYCRWLSARTGRRYRLPTEAEWEYACRAGALPAGPLPSEEQLQALAWHRANAEGRTHPVRRKAPNAWGLHDVLGNAMEWCRGLDDRPVARGGSYRDAASDVHPAARQFKTPAWQATDPQFPKSEWWLTDAPFVGFRVVCEAPDGSETR